MSDRRRRFVEEYLVDCNATGAAVRAGYSPKSADTIGRRLKNAPAVRRALETAFAEKRRESEVDRARIVAELARIAFADISQFLAWDGERVAVKDAAALTPEQTACVAEIVESGAGAARKLRIKLHSKTRALENLCRLFGLYDEKERAVAEGHFTIVSRVPEPGPADAAASGAR